MRRSTGALHTRAASYAVEAVLARASGVRPVMGHTLEPGPAWWSRREVDRRPGRGSLPGSEEPTDGPEPCPAGVRGRRSPTTARIACWTSVSPHGISPCGKRVHDLRLR